VASTVVGLDGLGHAGQFADFAQWEQWIAEQETESNAPAANAIETPATTAAPAKKKLSYMEAREFATIEQRVEESDARLAAAREMLEKPAIASDATALQAALAELAAAEEESHKLYARWAELSEKAG
jgi:ABC transport system ATP-binding/permease protein